MTVMSVYYSVDCNITKMLLKMLLIFINIEYVDILYFYDFCDSNTIAAIEQYYRRAESQIVECFPRFCKNKKKYKCVNDNGIFENL